MSLSRPAGGRWAQGPKPGGAAGLLFNHAWYDGFGRTVLTREQEGGGVSTKVETKYDALGRVWQVSNPYRNTAAGWTVTGYDGLGRVVTVTQPGGAVTATEYTGPSPRVVDPAGKERTLTRDGLGRLTQVREGPAGGATTSYGYNLLDNLTSVSQSGQTRSFTYDGVGWLLTAQNPENGTISYAYDASGNLQTKTDARGAVTTMSYDALGRLTTKSYTVPSGVEATSSVSYTYDLNFTIDGVLTENRPVGRLVRAANGESETVYRHDGLGRPLASRQTTSSTAYVFQYAHVPAGLSATWYPTGRVVRHSFDGAGRIGAVYGEKDANTTWYATGVAYAEHGALERMTVGGSRTEQWCYNQRLQPLAIRLGSAASAGCAQVAGDLLHLGYGYGPDANNNGNVWGQTIQRPSFAATQSYGYNDPMNRLTSVTEGAEYRNFGYSTVGNMWAASWSGNLTPGSFTPTSSSWFNSSNRLVNAALGIQYDAAGNLTQIGGYTFGDAEGRVAKSTLNSVVTQYLYDAEGRRVKKGSAVMVYDAFGKLAAEYGGTAESGGTEYLTGDHLGSTRVVTDGAGVVKRCQDYLPFGEQIQQGVNGRGSCCGVSNEPRQKFTGKERDAETGLDYFIARYYSPAQGRFTSPDDFRGGPVDLLGGLVPQPGPLQYGEIQNPQSLNKYTYAYNNPLRYIDPDGHEAEDLEDEIFVAGMTALGGTIGAYFGASAGGAGGGAIGAFAGGVGAIPGAAGGSAIGAAMGGSLGAAVGYGLGKATVFFANMLQGDQTGRRADKVSNDNSYEASKENIERMKQRKPQVDKQGKSVELHHANQNPKGPLQEMSQQQHRGAGNYRLNHPKGNQQPSQINRREFSKERSEYWKRKAEELERERNR